MRPTLHRRDGRGMALVTALLFTFLVLALGTALLTMATQEQVAAKAQGDVVVARSLAEAGIDKAIWKLNQDPTWRCTGGSDFKNVAVSDPATGAVAGYWTVDTITENSTTKNITITAHGVYPNATTNQLTEKIVKVSAFPKAAALFTAGALGKTTVELGGGTDSYNSAVGAYNSSNPGKKSAAQTLSLISGDLTYGSIKGKAIYGYGANPTAMTCNRSLIDDGDADETNDVQVPSAPVSLPAVVIPTGLTNLGTISDGQTIPAGTYRCDSISVKGNSSITTTGKVILYCTGVVEFKGKGSMYPSTGKPADLQLWCTNSVTGMDLCGNGNTTAVIYAPNAEIRMNGGGNTGAVYGAVIGSSIRFNGNHTWVHYDEQLKNIQGATIGYQPRSWEEG